MYLLEGEQSWSLPQGILGLGEDMLSTVSEGEPT